MKIFRRYAIPITAWTLPGVLLAAALLAGCNSGPGESASKMTSYTNEESHADTAELFTIPQEQMSHVQVVAVEKTKLARVLRMTGTVTYNLFKTTPVFTAVSGPVHEILVTPGENVKAGQPLLTVNSPDYSLLRSAYIKARDAFQLAEKNYNRSKDLFDHHAIAERDLEQAESDRAQAQADLQSSEAGLRVLGVPDPEALVKGPPTFQVPLLAPVGGLITDRLVGPGQLLAAGTTQCFTISDMTTVWVMLNVYQSDLGAVRVGDTVEITTDSYPDVFHGRVSYVAAAVLRDTENQPFVYVQTESNKFARRLVTLGEIQGGQTQITAGLKGNEHVVGDGSLFLQFKNSLQH